MFIIDITYNEEGMKLREKYLEAHHEFVNKGYESGNLLYSGPKKPRLGGVIIANFTSLAACEAYITADPFYIHNMYEYKIIEFEASNRK